MKVRFENDAVRFRLTPEELTTLMSGGAVGTTIRVSLESFSIVLQRGPDQAPHLLLDDRALILRLGAAHLECVGSEESFRCECGGTSCLVEIDRHAHKPGRMKHE